MKGGKLLAVCDERALSIINIDKAEVEKHTVGNRDLTRLFKMPLPDENGTLMFAGCSSSGLIKIFTEVLLDNNNNLERTDMDPFRIDNVKILKSAGIQHS